MNDLFNTTVLGRGNGTFGTFVVQDGTVKKGSNIILTFFNQMVLVPANARSTFTVPAEHQLFDGLLFALMGAKIGVEYIADVRSFLNPDLRMAEFLKLDAAAAAEFNTRFGLKLTAEELRLAAIQASVTKKFGVVFATPKTVVPAIAIDVDKVFGTNAELVAKWLRNEVTDTNSMVRAAADRGTHGANNLLRIAKNNNGRTNGVQCLTGHRVSITAFKEATKRCVAAWNNGSKYHGYDYLAEFSIEARSRGSSYNNGRTVKIYQNYVAVGCQQISRSEIERIAAELEAI